MRSLAAIEVFASMFLLGCSGLNLHFQVPQFCLFSGKCSPEEGAWGYRVHVDPAGSKAAPSSPEVLLSVCDELCHAKNPLQGGVDKTPWPGHHVWITAWSKSGQGLLVCSQVYSPQNCFFCPSFEGGRMEKQRRFLSQLLFLSAAEQPGCILFWPRHPPGPAQCIFHAVGWHLPAGMRVWVG